MARDSNSSVEPTGHEAQSVGERDGGSDDAPIGAGEPPTADPNPRSASAEDLSNEPTDRQYPVGKGAAENVDDDVNISSREIFSQRLDMDYGLGSDDAIREIRDVSDEYAKVTGLYVEGLQARVSRLESHVRELQTEIGWRARIKDADNERPSLDGPCCPSLSLDPLRLSIKELRNKAWVTMLESDPACLILGLTSGHDSFHTEALRSTVPKISNSRLGNLHVQSHGSVSHTAEGTQPRATELARITVTSPWLSIVIELLTGHTDTYLRGCQLIYPFKYLVLYQKQIKMFVKLLDEIGVDSLKVGEMMPTLTQVVKQVVASLGPERIDFTHSIDSTAKIVLKWDSYFLIHLKKAQKSSPADEGMEEPDVCTDQLLSSGNNTGIGQSDEKRPKVAEHELLRLRCTCLKDARDHLQLLCTVIDEHLSDLLLLHSAVSNRSVKKIKFQDLWLLYNPGDLVVSSKAPLQAYQVLHISGGRPLMTKSKLTLPEGPEGSRREVYQDQDRKFRVSPFKIDCVRFDFDGEKFGPVNEIINIAQFDEERNIVELGVYPIDFAEDKAVLRKTLLTRGQRFAAFGDFKHQKYAGLSLGDPPEEIESEVIVDITLAFRQPQYAKYRPQLGLMESSLSDCRETYEDCCVDWECLRKSHNRILDDTKFDDFRTDNFVNAQAEGLLLESSYSDQTLSEDQLILLPHGVHGFSLRSRRWVSLNIDSLYDIHDNDTPDSQYSAFDDLVIPEEYKKTVKALVKNHALGSGNSHQIDLVRGKGKGLVILLHGVPGVGKTSTAECVAMYTGRPLFPITCGDIGQTAQDVEGYLEGVFFLARKWGCVLLLDEADVFLAKRDPTSVERNALVSVFLRTLEYYSGILFLTTNRVGAFDEAFISRIHMSLYYADLTQESALGIWDMNLGRLKKSGRNIFVKDEQIKSFAKSHWREGGRWNGRQIRNAFQTAIALAEYDFHENCEMCEQTGEKLPVKPALRPEHFKAVVQTSAEFDNYLSDVHGGLNHRDKAKMTEIRSDKWQDQGIETLTGKKYSTERARRPSPYSKNGAGQLSEQVILKPPVQKEAILAEATEAIGTDSKEDEEFRQWQEEKQRKEQEEKTRRFELRAKELEKGR